jgi:hypothetical protein
MKLGYKRAIISVCGKNSKNKWIDLAINITSANNIPVSGEIYEKIMQAFNQVNILRALPKAKKPPINRVKKITQNLVSAAMEAVGNPATVQAPIMPLNAIE